jgi:hypothetical protein
MPRSLAVLALLVAAAALAADWTEVVCPEGGFAVGMPSAPVRSERTFTSGEDQVTEVSYASHADGLDFVIAYDVWSQTDIGAIPVEEVIDAIQTGAVDAAAAEVVSTQGRRVGGFAGREILFQDDAHATFHFVCPLGDRVLQAAVVCPERDPSAETLAAAHRFFDSLRLLGGEGRE